MLIVLRFGMFFLVCPRIVPHTREIGVSDHWKTKFGIVKLFSFVPGYNGTQSTPHAQPTEIWATNLAAHV